MVILSGLITISYVTISGIVGVRLLRRAGGLPRPAAGARPGLGGQLPEFWLGIFFLLYSCIAASMNIGVYAAWSDPALALPDPITRFLHGGFFWIGGVGLLGLLIFTRQTFRPGSAWARRLVWTTSLALLLATIWIGISEGYAVMVLNGSGYWIQFSMRQVVFLWVALESLRYWRLLRRRMRLGLVEPLVANRFLLVGLWGVALAILAHADSVARVWYYLETGSTTEWIPAVGRPILLFGMSTASAFLSVGGVAIFLAFFPTRAYSRWVRERSPTPA